MCDVPGGKDDGGFVEGGPWGLRPPPWVQVPSAIIITF